MPAAWTVVIDRLRAHGLAFTTLTKPLTQEVETYQVRPGGMAAASHSRTTIMVKDVKFAPVRRKMTFPAGSAVVYLDQPGARVAMHLLEPDAPDSLLRWGYLDAIFEQKEYAEERVMEAMAREMMARDPKLKEEFEKKVADRPGVRGQRARAAGFFLRAHAVF